MGFALAFATQGALAQCTGGPIHTVQTDQYSGGSTLGDHLTITAAINCADLAGTPGQVVEVWESLYSMVYFQTGAWDGIHDPKITTYDEHITFPSNKDISIVAVPQNPLGVDEIAIVGTGTGSVVTFLTAGNTRSSLLDGFTIRGGLGQEDPWLGDSSVLTGGGIQCLGATPTISNCLIKQNQAMLGGGIYASPGTFEGDQMAGPLILDCVIESNDTHDTAGGLSFWEPSGGGICAMTCSPEIKSTSVQWNTSDYSGGGVTFNGFKNVFDQGTMPRPIVEDSQIHDNNADQQGGGLFFWVLMNPAIERCLITNNTAADLIAGTGGEGGGVYWDNCTVELSTSVISNNRAGSAGAGIVYEGEGHDPFAGSGQATPASTITHCTIARNQTTDNDGSTMGGGILGRLAAYPAPVTTVFENCLLAYNKADLGAGANIKHSQTSFQNCTISQNAASAGGLAGGVLFDNDLSGTLISFQDSIVTENRIRGTQQPANAWEVDFLDFSSTLQFVPPFNYCLMATASGYVKFSSGLGNLVTRARFATGSAWTYFPTAGFYLSHAPEQTNTSAAFDAGSQLVGPLLAANGMTCRTNFNLADVNMVDMGFHYPALNGLP